MKEQVERINADVHEGLSSVEVAQRKKTKLTNKVNKTVGKSYLQIFASNIFTFFNLLGLIIFALMLICGAYSDMLFVVVILANTVIGIFQEIRSKLAVEKLSIVSEPTATVVRNGEKQSVKVGDVVLDDVVLFSAGKQVCCDSVIVIGEVEVNESMLTGESLAVKKSRGDLLYSGSYVVSGSCTCRADKVGKDCYVEQLSAKVKKAKTPDSQLMKGIRSIIKIISLIIFPLGIATFLMSSEIAALGTVDGVFGKYIAGSAEVVTNVNNAIRAASGSMIGMVPSGMVLLTSVALAVAALKLAKRKVLVRELPCIEVLARVDTLCLDKTGTITDGSMTVEQIIPLSTTEADVQSYLATLLAATGDGNATAQAISAYVQGAPQLEHGECIPFSSERKYSAVTLKKGGTVVLGAPEFLFEKTEKSFQTQCKTLTSKGLRVLAVGFSKKPLADGKVVGAEPIAILALQDSVRSDAPQIIGWFKQNDVEIKVISGDDPLAVSVIAAKAGVANADKYVSLEGMTDEQVAQAATEYSVFGRVTPEQKALLVRALKKAGKTVAMTGDGVNDILAMRESDCAISVGSGTDAAKTVANLVLTDDKFGSLPKVVAEGRQVVNNVQNSASLFLMKTCMTVLTTITLLFLPSYSYPFTPQNLYAIEFFVIGIPSFLLALKPNESLITGNFLKNTFRKTLPSGIAMYLSVACTYLFAGVMGLTEVGGVYDANQISTVAMLAMTFTGVVGLLVLLYPYDKINFAIGGIGVVGTGLLFAFIEKLYNGILQPEPDKMMKIIYSIPTGAIIFIVVDVLVMCGLMILGNWLVNKYLPVANAQTDADCK